VQDYNIITSTKILERRSNMLQQKSATPSKTPPPSFILPYSGDFERYDIKEDWARRIERARRTTLDNPTPPKPGTMLLN
jgi:hypothetical protein